MSQAGDCHLLDGRCWTHIFFTPTLLQRQQTERLERLARSRKPVDDRGAPAHLRELILLRERHTLRETHFLQHASRGSIPRINPGFQVVVAGATLAGDRRDILEESRDQGAQGFGSVAAIEVI